MDGTITVSFQDVSLEDALSSILKANGLDYAVENGVFRVGAGDHFSNTGEDLKTETIALRYASAIDLKTQLQPLLSTRGSVIADERTNTLTVKDMSANLDQLHRTIASVDLKDQQVLIEAKIIEASRDFSRDLGVQWAANSDGTNRVDVSGLTPVGTSEQGNPLNQNLGLANPLAGIGLSLGRLAGGTNLELQIQAAEQQGKVRIISSPSIVTTNGKAAKIRSGETLLIRNTNGLNIATGATATTTTGSTVQEIETGIELNVTPQISLERHIKMVVEALTSQADFSRAIDGIPVILDNRATTTVLIKDTETTVIGGLVQNNKSTTKRGVPYLSKVPLFGNLFKSKSRRDNESELILFIKPTILDDSNAPLPVATPPILAPTALETTITGQAIETLQEAQKKSKSKY